MTNDELVAKIARRKGYTRNELGGFWFHVDSQGEVRQFDPLADTDAGRGQATGLETEAHCLVNCAGDQSLTTVFDQHNRMLNPFTWTAPQERQRAACEAWWAVFGDKSPG